MIPEGAYRTSPHVSGMGSLILFHLHNHLCGASDLSKYKSGHILLSLGHPSPVTHHIKNKMQTAHQSPFKQPDTSSLSPHHSAPAKRASSLLLQHDRHHPAPGPLHRLWPLPGPLFWIPWLTPCHSDFTQKPLPWGAIAVHPQLFQLVICLPQWTWSLRLGQHLSFSAHRRRANIG